MRVLYGVVGEGMGHAMRSGVVLSHLLERGHDIEVMASGRAVNYLSGLLKGVNRIHGFHMVYEENRVRRGKTLVSNVADATVGIPSNIAAYFDLITRFSPEVVISDFESWTYLYGKIHGLPVLSIDNMQIMNRTRLPETVIQGYENDFQITKAFVKSKLPFCDRYFITSFFRPSLRKENTRLFPPILRKIILDAPREKGEHLLVYTTGEGNKSFSETLRKTGVECRIYGMQRDLTKEEIDGNLRLMPFSEEGFVKDLASCKGVIASGGFTLMGEAVYLQKPMLAVPLGLQFEQVLNARYLDLLGYGRMAQTLEDPRTVDEFIAGIPEYEESLANWSQDGNREILSAIDQWLQEKEADG